MEERHRRAKLLGVEGAEDLLGGLRPRRENRRGTLAEARSEDRMIEVGDRLGQRDDREVPGDVAAPEARDLGKDEPDPVAALPSPPELLEDGRVDVLLFGEESAEVVRVVSPRIRTRS